MHVTDEIKKDLLIPDPHRIAAAVAVLHARQPVESVLLIRRATNPNDPWSGHWSFPGGRVDAADEDLVATALRELREECSIELAREALQQPLPLSVAGRRVGKFITVAPFLFSLESQLPASVDTREAVEHLWTPVSLLADRSRHRWGPVPGVPEERQFPSVALKGVPLWGFTYRVLCAWLGIEEPPQP